MLSLNSPYFPGAHLLDVAQFLLSSLLPRLHRTSPSTSLNKSIVFNSFSCVDFDYFYNSLKIIDCQEFVQNFK